MWRLALSEVERATLARMQGRLRADTWGQNGKRGFQVLDAYYDGEQRLQQLGIAVPAELWDFVTIIGFPGTWVDTLANRCIGTGFRLPGSSDADADLWRVWQANDLDDESVLAGVDSMVFGRAYGCVGSSGDDATPLVTMESPLEMIHESSAATRKITGAARFYSDESFGRTELRSTLYQPDETIHAVLGSRGWAESTDEQFARDEHGFGDVPVEPFTNRSRLSKRYGRSQILPIIGPTDAAARALTLTQVATEVMGLPQRTAAGLSQADFKDPATGEALTQWEAYFGAVWATANPNAKFHQFSAADLGNFKTVVDMYSQQVSGLTGLPLRYFGQATTNPPSADGIRADESRLIADCEMKNLSNGASYERLMAKVRRFQTGQDDPEMASMEMLWRDPATPTRAQAADAAVKLFMAGIVTKRQVRRDLGYTSVQIKNMEDDEAQEANSDPILERLDGLRAGGAGAAVGV